MKQPISKLENKKYINIDGQLFDILTPKVMGILNVTPDSFYPGSRCLDDNLIKKRVERMLADGVDIIDIGGCSTRPGFQNPKVEEELRRLNLGCEIVHSIAPGLPISIDTFRAEVASEMITRWNAAIINDVSGGTDPDMWTLIADKNVAYVLTHNREDGSSIYSDITAEVISELSFKLNELHRIGVNDVIIDPGFGFAKTLSQNLQLLDELNEVAGIGMPLLVGVSRKSMIYKTLGISPDESLTGTVVFNTVALEKGAEILRVHDVKEARQTIDLYLALKQAAHD